MLEPLDCLANLDYMEVFELAFMAVATCFLVGMASVYKGML